jgi:hypothetical protein
MAAPASSCSALAFSMPLDPATAHKPREDRKKSLHAAEQAGEDVAKARIEWREQQLTLTPSKLVFIDEAR